MNSLHTVAAVINGVLICGLYSIVLKFDMRGGSGGLYLQSSISKNSNNLDKVVEGSQSSR